MKCYLKLSKCDSRGYKGSRGRGVEGNVKELQRFESLAKVIRTLWSGDLGLIEKGVLGRLKKDIAESKRMLNALIKPLENKPLNP